MPDQRYKKFRVDLGGIEKDVPLHVQTCQMLASPTNNFIQKLYKERYSDYPNVLNLTQAADMFGISTDEVKHYIDNGVIPCAKKGNSYRIPKINMIGYLFETNKECQAV